METARVFGNNIRYYLNQQGISVGDFAEKLGYSFYDAQKLLDGRLFVTQQDMQDIAEVICVSQEELQTIKEDGSYVGEGFMDCMGKFKNPENQDKILDIFDMYCDIKEAAEL